MKKNDSVEFDGYIIREFTLKKIKNISKEQEKSLEIENTTDQSDKDKNIYRVSLNLTAYTKHSKLHLIIDGFFKIPKEIDENKRDNFLNISAPSIIYPYASAFISNVTGFDAGETLLLPLINFASKS